MARGSATRGGRSIVQIAPASGANSQAIAAGNAGTTFTFRIDEPCILGRLVISAAPTAGADATAWAGCSAPLESILEVTSFQLDSDILNSGSVPASAYTSDATQGINPFLGQQVNQNSVLTITIANRSGFMNVDVQVGIAVR